MIRLTRVREGRGGVAVFYGMPPEVVILSPRFTGAKNLAVMHVGPLPHSEMLRFAQHDNLFRPWQIPQSHPTAVS